MVIKKITTSLLLIILVVSSGYSQESISINGNRNIAKIEEGKYKVSVEIDKGAIEGFAKMTELIPVGFTASVGESLGGVFSFKENKAKILWMAVPGSEKFTITYNLEASDNASNGTYQIKGEFSYLLNDLATKYDIGESSFELNI